MLRRQKKKFNQHLINSLCLHPAEWCEVYVMTLYVVQGVAGFISHSELEERAGRLASQLLEAGVHILINSSLELMLEIRFKKEY